MSNSKLVYSIFVFFCFASSTIYSYAHKSKCSAQQSRTLLLFKNSLFSINDTSSQLTCQDWLGAAGYYPIMMNWKKNTDCCDWNGVTCNYFTGDVVGLDLSCGMLQGTIHPNTSLFNLPHLQKLNLAYNDFSGSNIPREIGKFSDSLTHLNVSECWFFGQVPSDITLLHKLVSLDLSWNDDLVLEPHVFVHVLQNSTSLEELLLADVNISSNLPDYLNISSSTLRLLNLQDTGLQGKLPKDIFISQSLEELDLSLNSFTGQIPSEISLLPELVLLDLSGYHNNLRIQPNIFNGLLNNSTLLRDLRLPYVNISWVLPTDVINISSSLNYLDIYSCNLMGSLPKYPLNLTHLTHLDLSDNKLNGTLPSWLFTLPSLETLYLDNNMFSGDVPFDSFALPPLKRLSLTENQLGGQIDQALIQQLTNLTFLQLSYNNFSSDWELDTLLSSLINLETLHLSYSGLAIRTSNATHQANHNLRFLSLASCKLKEFPVSLRYMTFLEDLDVSSNEIHGDVSFSTGDIGVDNPLSYLNLSHNLITGLPQFQLYGLHGLYVQSNLIEGPFPLSICNLSNLDTLDLSNNSFGGVIPQCLGNMTSSLSYLDLNSNQLHGLLPPSICNLPLFSLDLSNNHFGGVIPQCFGNFSFRLNVMDLGNNDFHGTIPNTSEDCGKLQGLILNGNQLQGELPTSMSSCHSLIVLDVGNNHLNDTFPHWLGGLSELKVLNLKSNNFHGRIATSSSVEFPFRSLRVLDLSHNRFVGQLPTKYFQNFNAMKNVAKMGTKLEYLNMSGEYYSINIFVKGTELDFPKISVEYTIVSLSNNSFEGKIPDVIGSLTSLIVLDLSHNSLTGHIPQDLGKLSEIESLDLSWNHLKGEIPQSLAELTRLEFLNLSQNHLVGRIPTGNQFNTFEVSSFGGNPNLCGLPLPEKCNNNPQEPHLDNDGDEDENGFTWRVVMLGCGCGTLFGLVMGYLMLSTGRPEWFNAISDEGERLILTGRKKRRDIIYIGR